MPEIPPRRRSRPAPIERYNTLTPIDSNKTNKSPPLLLPGAHLCSQQTPNSESESEEPIVDDEFQEYLDRAIVKCADWLMKYIFNDEKGTTSSPSTAVVMTERLVCI